MKRSSFQISLGREEPQNDRTLGLRHRKKAQQRLDLINVAVQLFEKVGYETARIEDVAEMANVSKKTVYNYFPAKRDILIEFLVRDRERSLDTFRSIVDAAQGDPIEDLLRLMEADFGYDMSDGERSLWLEIMAVTVKERGDERFRKYRFMFTSYIEILLGRLRDDRKLSKSLNLSLASKLIHTLHSENFDHYCTVKSLSLANALEMARAELELVFSDWTIGGPTPRSGLRKKSKPL